jgi:hypothetical protein
MPKKKIGLTIRPHNPRAMQFNRPLLREPVHDQQFIEWILQRIRDTRTILKRASAHLKRRLAKPSVYTEPFVGLASQRRRIEVKLQTRSVLKGPPGRPRVEQRKPPLGRERLHPLNSNSNIGISTFNAERL